MRWNDFETVEEKGGGLVLVLKTIATGSSGNSYVLMSDEEILLIDCGVNVMEIKKAIDFKISNVVGCIVSHKHL